MPTHCPPRRRFGARARRARAPRRGFALEMALLVMALFSVVVLAGFTTVATMARTAGADYQALRNSYALESAGEGVMAQVATAVVDGRLTPEELHVDAGRGLNGTSVSAQVETAEAPEMRPVATGPYAGLFALHQYFKIKVEARDSAAYHARAEIGVETQTIPAFQFAVFYQQDLEFHPGTPMSLAGRVHTNANLYVNHNIAFDGLVTAAESTFLAMKAGAPGGTVYIRNAANAPVLLDFDSRSLGRRAFRGRSEQLFNGRLMSAAHGVKPLRLPIPDNVPPEALLAPRDPQDDALLQSVKLAWQADLHVTVHGDVFALGDTTQIPGALCDGGLLEIERPAGMEVPTGADCKRIFKVRRNAFVDTREGRSADLLDIHMDSLKWWSDLAPATRAPKVLYVRFVDVNRANPMHDLLAVRVRQGRAMPNPRSTADSTGLTVATEEPLYVLGDYNTINWRPSALMADAVIALSPPPNPAMSAQPSMPASQRCGVTGVAGWCDNQQQVARVRRARAGTINAALLVGHTPTACDTRRSGCPFAVSGGGAHNVIDFREDWSGLTHRYTGSIVSLTYRRRMVAPFGMTYFAAPIRLWGFDTRFLSPNRLPPGSPAVGTAAATSFRLMP